MILAGSYDGDDYVDDDDEEEESEEGGEAEGELCAEDSCQ